MISWSFNGYIVIFTWDSRIYSATHIADKPLFSKKQACVCFSGTETLGNCWLATQWTFSLGNFALSASLRMWVWLILKKDWGAGGYGCWLSLFEIVAHLLIWYALLWEPFCLPAVEKLGESRLSQVHFCTPWPLHCLFWSAGVLLACVIWYMLLFSFP